MVDASIALTVNELSKKIRDKRDLYEACLRNGFYLPAIKSNMVNEAYMLNVMTSQYFCLKFEKVRMKACPRPPHKSVLVKKFLDLMKDRGPHGLVQSEDKSLLPDKKWLIDVIATLNPEDEIFNKDYLPPARAKNMEEQKTILLPKDFLSNIPDSRSKAKCKRLKLTSEGRSKQRVLYMKRAKKQLDD